MKYASSHTEYVPGTLMDLVDTNVDSNLITLLADLSNTNPFARIGQVVDKGEVRTYVKRLGSIFLKETPENLVDDQPETIYFKRPFLTDPNVLMIIPRYEHFTFSADNRNPKIISPGEAARQLDYHLLRIVEARNNILAPDGIESEL